MGLVDYSDSDSDSPQQPVSSAPTAAPKPQSSFLARPKKTTVTKLIDRSNPGKIIVDLSSLADDSSAPANDPSSSADNNEPPAKRARTGGGAGSFAGFNAMLPAPKNKGTAISGGLAKLDRGEGGARPVVQLKTSAEPGFSRAPPAAVNDSNEDSHQGGGGGGGMGMGMALPPPRASTGPSIPDGQKRPEDVKLVGKPLAFKPLSVSRKPVKKKVPVKPVAAVPTTSTTTTTTTTTAPEVVASAPEPTPAPRRSLFTFAEPTYDPEPDPNPEPQTDTTTTLAGYDYSATYHANPPAPSTSYPPPTTDTQTASLDSVANDLNLSASERRAIFGRQKRGDAMPANLRVVNMGTEYDRNEALRTAGDLQPTHQPVRTMQPGKHNVRQMVNMVHNQREALEESFARDKNTKREASSRYGW